MMTRILGGLACAAMLCGCNCGGSSTTCSNMGNSTWVGTEDVAISSETCPSPTGVSVTFTVTQASGSCTFDLTNSRVEGITFAGTVSGKSVTWSHAPYAYLGGTLTLDTVDATLSADEKALSGNFKWTLAQSSSSCTGTTTFDVAKQ